MINNFSPLSSALESTAQAELLSLIENAEVSVGNWGGRLISVPGHSGQITFSKFSARVETVYQESVGAMQKKQKQYEEDSTSTVDIMPLKGKGSLFLNLMLSPITVPLKAFGDAMCWAQTPYVEISEKEEKEIALTFEWREKINSELDHLFEVSQQKIDQRATESYTGKISKAWDSFLDTRSTYTHTLTNDREILANMVKIRNQKATLTPIIDIASAVMPTAGAIFGAATVLRDKYSLLKKSQNVIY